MRPHHARARGWWAGMPAAGVLLDLALLLDAGQPETRQDHAAMLAGRLGYADVWMPAGGEHGFPDRGRLAALAAAAGPARPGVVLPAADDAMAWLLRLAPDHGSEVLLELPERSAALIHAVGGADAWRARVWLPSFDAEAAGTVIATASRAGTVTAVAAAVAARAAAGIAPYAHPVAASLPVSIGRTLNEAEARASRDPRFATAAHPRERGLFGTHEQAQRQVLDLAAAGADTLRVAVPDEVDVADLLAQVRSLVVGATPVLHARGS